MWGRKGEGILLLPSGDHIFSLLNHITAKRLRGFGVLYMGLLLFILVEQEIWVLFQFFVFRLRLLKLFLDVPQLVLKILDFFIFSVKLGRISLPCFLFFVSFFVDQELLPLIFEFLILLKDLARDF